MKRKIIQINKQLCVGCGICAKACHENAIKIVQGKAELSSDHHCDGLGNCLPLCPHRAISIVEIETIDSAREYHSAVITNIAEQSSTLTIQQDSTICNWPIQIKLIPVSAPYFNDAHLLVSADCCAYAYPRIHTELIAGKVILIGCPKLDDFDPTEKLTAIMIRNTIQSVTICRMEVPCCAGMEHSVIAAIRNSGKDIPCTRVTFTRNGAKSES
jgi:ferredoxin